MRKCVSEKYGLVQDYFPGKIARVRAYKAGRMNLELCLVSEMSQKSLGSFGFCSRSSTQGVQSTAETTDTSENVGQNHSELEPEDDLIRFGNSR